MKVEVLDLAERDLEDGYRFYERQSPGVGDYFLDSLCAEIDSLALYAGIHRIFFGYHRLLARKFPHAVYYKVVGNVAQVWAVVDCRRDPEWIRQKLPPA